MKEYLDNRAPDEPIPSAVEEAGKAIIGAAIEVHRHLGPGLLESIYECALTHELRLRGMTVHRQVPVAVSYKSLEIGGQRLNIFVEPGVIVELKAVDRLSSVHEAQLISYLRSTGHRLGLLINFNHELLRQGLKRIVC